MSSTHAALRWTAGRSRLGLLLAVVIVLALALAALGWPGPWRPLAGDGQLAAAPPRGAEGDTLAVLYSGDGGWAALDKGLGDGLARGGLPVIGYNSLRYFSTPRTAGAAAADLAAALRRQMAAHGERRVVLVGFSFGANALPAIVPRLPADLRARIRLVALVGPGRTGALRFTPRSWFNRPSPGDYAVPRAIAALKGEPMVCIYGDREPHPVCPSLPSALIRRIVRPGGHHYDGDYAGLSRTILRALPA